MNKLMNSSMLGLAPIAPTQTLISEQDEERPATKKEICRPVIERMATDEEIARIREELQVVDPGGKNRRW
jgi:hypothetical protein